MTIAGFVLLGPVAARQATRVLGAPLPRLRGVTGSLARRNAMRSPRRTSATATALMIGVGVVTVFTVFLTSLQGTVDAATAKSFTGDLAISAGWDGGFSPGLADRVGEVPQVRTVVGLGSDSVLLDGDRQQVSVAAPRELAALTDLDVTSGRLAGLHDDQIAVSERKADDDGLTLGSPLAGAAGRRHEAPAVRRRRLRPRRAGR